MKVVAHIIYWLGTLTGGLVSILLAAMAKFLILAILVALAVWVWQSWREAWMHASRAVRVDRKGYRMEDLQSANLLIGDSESGETALGKLRCIVPSRFQRNAHLGRN